jgi:putative endonuclease
VNRNTQVGKYGEDRACEFLERLGYKVIDRNWRCSAGEIDVIAHDENCLVFAEVKTRTRVGFGHPFEAITSAKMRTMRQLVGEWCKAHQVSSAQVRLDAVSVLLTGGKVHIEHLKQVF